ncbi:hypothetical protein A3C20_00065 [Candidatus Kaiserbacteria bacterium RIFCSPHIGHO2_02_FULL_55_25]|uniref:Uncharacterized protein n=1 Tax=Candidatus Kaiserbacteria bacterium RIFCSPHIGHO2_02_FULL_55_25 TaxID=1798498 RepID=A0A1F6E7W7_9BACT|nr:MAG: hypothetical protein A2764_01635 [Candidatus Kaiserbacteria bacterium RIFCSPHIGHO2_01_FULL_55_79]OGG69748.1 MAG: hypothetical protein A3C20_00065 [Candidatus Kaiserbacteria bacterium RIFCSPHIGHO2_02_FULL_55_25]OGG77557.1 MAG: hypothetical protein A3F56_01985 [Candidatus Kaiserbacteria bacterium RIFCSPHIGHO2_12_FULL_55_13]OGG83192.1 MAG: hypothetical protein A3A42_01340 [Candidatus Kaiserbacteria bacterium RIFCSPLOWO2_01_FULL_55_25]
MPKHQQSLAIFAIVVLLAAFSYLAVRHNQAVGRESSEVYVSPDEPYSSTAVELTPTPIPAQ